MTYRSSVDEIVKAHTEAKIKTTTKERMGGGIAIGRNSNNEIPRAGINFEIVGLSARNFGT